MKTFITTALAVLIGTMMFGQEKKADRLFRNWQYAEAAQLYEEAAKNDSSPDLYYKLGQCYQKMFRFREAAEAYDRVNAAGEYNEAAFYLNYGLVLKANERYLEAREAFQKYDSMASNDPRGKFYLQSCDSVLDDLQKPVPVRMTNVESINSEDATFGAVRWVDGLVYASNNPNSTGDKIFPWTGKSYLDLYFSRRAGSDTTFEGPQPFPSKYVNRKYHDGPATFSRNGDTIYFNRVERSLKGEKKRTLGVERSKIYYCVLKDGEWSKEKPFVFNSDSFGVFTPFLSADGSRLYFASDMPGGMGETDIYYCEKQPDNSWGLPKNAGSTVNTFGREEFPVLDSAGNLYFASDGYMGYGGLDICVAQYTGGSFAKAQVLKTPLNSADNDYGITFIRSGISGYVTSSRRGGKGDADIYYFDLGRDSIPCEVNTTIFVMGYYCIPKKEGIALEGRDSLQLGSSVEKDISRTVLMPIYFDFDKSAIRADARPQLDSITTVLRAHPDWDLEIGGHADSRGTDAYNVALSQRRANSAVRYLTSRGIDPARLSTKAYGESLLLNRCSNGVPCSEPEHQVNRRVEFKVVLRKQPVSLR